MMLLREARLDDEAAWLEIRNEPEARFWSGVQKEITPEEHAAWFRRALSSPVSVLQVAEEDGKMVGYARMEIDLVGTVSFGVASEYRGKGIGTGLLASLDSVVATQYVTRQAWAHPSNIPSIRAFMRRGYMIKGEPGYVLLSRPSESPSNSPTS